FARARLVVGAHHPHRGQLAVVLPVQVTELAAALAVVRAAVGQAHFDAGLAQHVRHAFGVFHALAGEDLAHAYSLLSPVAGGATRIRPSCAVLATSTPSRVKNWPRARPRESCALGLSSEYSSQSSTRNGRWNQMAWSSEAICTCGW